MSNNSSFFERASHWLKTSVTIRLLTIGILILLLLIPVSMVRSLIKEREYRKTNAISEVSSKWGKRQTINGLVLTIPYLTYIKVVEDAKNDKYRMEPVRNYAHFLPHQLNINGDVIPEKRYRGIYEVVVYNSKVKLDGNFTMPDFDVWNVKSKDVLWDEAFVALGLSDMRSIQNNVAVKWNGEDYMFNPGIEVKDVIKAGMSVRVPVGEKEQKDTKWTFEMALDFNGSSALNFTPLGKNTVVKLKSTWKDPSFDGAFLPDDRIINEDGFNAEWNVLHLNRTYPQSFKGSTSGIAESAFGVNLIVPAGEYQKSMRSAKYAALFITLTFMLFFFAQIMNKVRIHPIQYIMVGLALCIFYTLLIALSEHIPFQWSYLISSFAIISLIVMYAHSIFKNIKLTSIITGILVILYGFIYVIIQLQDYALLVGSIGLFIVLAAVMYLSRKIDWYNIQTTKEG